MAKIKARIGDNVVDIEVPDGFTEEQISKALEEHPDVQNLQNPPKSFPRAAAERTAGFVNEMGKGIPVAGNYIPRSQYAKDLVKDYPKTAMGARLAGGVASTAPLMAMTMGGAGTPLAMNMIRQGLTGGAINVADKVAEKGTDTSMSDLAWSGGLGTMGGAAGPLIGKFISPASVRAPHEIAASENAIRDSVMNGLRSAYGVIPRDASPERQARMAHQALGIAIEDFERRLANVPRTTPPSERVLDTLMNGISGGAMGYGLGHIAGQEPITAGMMGGLLGHAFGPPAREFLRNSRYGRNAFMDQHPSAQSILDALGSSVVSSVPPNE